VTKHQKELLLRVCLDKNDLDQVTYVTPQDMSQVTAYKPFRQYCNNLSPIIPYIKVDAR